MKINFVINEPIRQASGGYKMVYIYANKLAENNHEVNIIYRCRKNVLFSNYMLPYFIKFCIAKCIIKKGPKWFCTNSKVKHIVVSEINNTTIPDGDVIIATAADTAFEVNDLCELKGKKYYFIQGYETWVYEEELLHKTYKLPMKKIVISKWLKEKIVIDNKCDIRFIPNGIDNSLFKTIINPKDRTNESVIMLYHDLESKGSEDGLEVIQRLKLKFPSLRVILFGIVKKPNNLPEWIEYYYNVKQEKLVELYNHSAIYVCPSWNEGFGLTAAEAMMCGCALVSTRTQGVLEYANTENAKLVEIQDKEKMYQYCCELIKNHDERIQLANKGSKEVSEKLNYEKSINEFINYICEGKNDI